jgi:Uma2 family endonuclease
MATPHVEAKIPPLESGDLLTREEFYRRWDLHPEIKKAERINGRVFLETTVRRKHARPHGSLSAWLGVFAAGRENLESLLEATVRLADDDLQPDLVLRFLEGSSSVGEDDCVEGPPELVVEVSASSVAHDLNQKNEAYRRNGVAEYLVWQVFENRIDWWQLTDDEYVAIEPNAEGVIESRQFPGLRLKRDAMLAGDMAAVLAAL